MILTNKNPKEIISQLNEVTSLQIVGMNDNQTQFIITINDEYIDIFRGIPLIRGHKIIYDETFTEEDIEVIIKPMGIWIDDVKPTIIPFEEYLKGFTKEDNYDIKL